MFKHISKERKSDAFVNLQQLSKVKENSWACFQGISIKLLNLPQMFFFFHFLLGLMSFEIEFSPKIRVLRLQVLSACSDIWVWVYRSEQRSQFENRRMLKLGIPFGFWFFFKGKCLTLIKEFSIFSRLSQNL